MISLIELVEMCKSRYGIDKKKREAYRPFGNYTKWGNKIKKKSEIFLELSDK